MEQAQREEAIAVALDVALLVMRNGGSTSTADRAFRNILKGFHEDETSTAWRLDVVTASASPVDGGRSIEVVRLVGAVGANLVRVSESAILAERMARGEIAASVIASEVRRIERISSPYDRWAMMAAAVCVAGAFSQLSGGDWGALVISCAAVSVGQLLRSSLLARGGATVPVTLVCGALSACIAAAGLRLGLSRMTWETLIASVIYMAPGLPLINGFVDMESQRHLLVGLERIAYAVFLILILAIDIAFAYTTLL